MKYILGLGNPGEKYQHTRHNVGFLVLDYIAETESFAGWSKSKGAQAFFSRGTVGEEPVELLKPETFMNQSGKTVQYVVRKHEAKPSDFILIYDDVDLALGELKISEGRGAGGHNGVSSVINALGSKDFARIRIGISPKSFWTGKTKRPQGEALNKYVLGRFTKKELATVAEVGERASGALRTILTNGVSQAMNQYNQ